MNIQFLLAILTTILFQGPMDEHVFTPRPAIHTAGPVAKKTIIKTQPATTTSSYAVAQTITAESPTIPVLPARTDIVEVPLIASVVHEPSNPIINEPATQPSPEPTMTITEPAPTNLLPEQVPASIEIISPIPGKGLNREYIATPDDIVDESNYIELGAIIRNKDGMVLDSPQMTITATDETQNKTEIGTGNEKTIYVDGAKQTVRYYPFHYEFHEAGTHVIKFESAGVVQEISLIAK